MEESRISASAFRRNALNQLQSGTAHQVYIYVFSNP